MRGAPCTVVYLRKMRRFWTKKEIPCHQQGKQSGSPDEEVGVEVAVSLAVLLVGCTGGDCVTAAGIMGDHMTHAPPMPHIMSAGTHLAPGTVV